MKQAKAVYSFTARNDNEISFEAGDLIYVIEEDPATGWCKGRTIDYKEGYFPLNYVEIEEVPDSDSDNEDTSQKKGKLMCIALYDFSAQLDTQVSFKKGEIIIITKKGNDNDWWEGESEQTRKKGLIPSNYVKLVTPSDQQTSANAISDNGIQSSTSTSSTSTSSNTTSNAPPQSSVPLSEANPQTQPNTLKTVDPSQVHILDGRRSDFSIGEISGSSSPALSSLGNTTPNISSVSSQRVPDFQSTPLDFSSPLNNSFDLFNERYKEFAALSPISPSMSTLSSAESARRRHSMHLGASPLSLSVGGELPRDLDALGLLYPYLPSSVSSQNVPLQPLFSPSMLPPSPSSPSQQPLVKPPSAISATLNFNRPQSAPQPIPQTITQPTSQPTQSPLTKPAAPKPSIATNSPERKDRYSKDRPSPANTSLNSSTSSTSSTSTNTSTGSGKVQVRTANTSTGKYSTAKSSGKRDPNTSTTGGRRKAKLEGSLVLGKKSIASIANSAENQQDAVQISLERSTSKDDQSQQQLSEVEYLKKVLLQEAELRAHLESVVHDAHGKLSAAAHYIKDLKAELFQSNMDISQLRLTNRQLSEQLNKYQLVTRVTVATQTERDENIDKIRVLTEQINELNVSTEVLNDQITTLKVKSVERAPRSPRSPLSPRSPRSPRENGYELEKVIERPRQDVSADYSAVKQQFARVRACLMLEKEEINKLVTEKTQMHERLLKTEQHSKQIKRKLLSELQLKSDLNVRNQQIEFQMQKLKDELALYKHK